MVMQSWKDLALMVCENRSKLKFFKRGKISIISLQRVKTQNSGTFLIYLTYQQSTSWNYLTLLWLWNTIKIAESRMSGESSVSSPTRQSLWFIIIIVLEKFVTLFLTTYGQSAGRPNTDHYVDWHFKVNQKHIICTLYFCHLETK